MAACLHCSTVLSGRRKVCDSCKATAKQRRRRASEVVVKRDTASLAEVVAEGDRRASLEALRDRLAAAAERCAPNELPGLARQLTAVMDKLDALPTPEGSVVDEIAQRRAVRLARAAD